MMPYHDCQVSQNINSLKHATVHDSGCILQDTYRLNKTITVPVCTTLKPDGNYYSMMVSHDNVLEQKVK